MTATYCSDAPDGGIRLDITDAVPRTIQADVIVLATDELVERSQSEPERDRLGTWKHHA